MAITHKPWNGAASKYSDTAAYCRACLVNENTGDSADWTQEQCHLPVYEENGDVNANGVHNAASRLMQTKISPELKKKAARKLKRLYGEMNEEAPDSVKNMAM